MSSNEIDYQNIKPVVGTEKEVLIPMVSEVLDEDTSAIDVHLYPLGGMNLSLNELGIQPNVVEIQEPSSEQKTRSKRTLEAFSLEGKVCVVTGGASGIGYEICKAIVASGGEVAIVDLNGEMAEHKKRELAATYQSSGVHDITPLITAHSSDVSSPTSIDEAITSIIASHSQIDHLITSAGFCENFDAVSYPYKRMQKLWSVNVDGTYCFATAIARHLMARSAKGSIVFIASMSGNIVNVPQHQTPYNISKAAVKHMARSLAVEWAGNGIRVNSISPGYMMTPLLEKIIDEDPALYQDWLSRTPMGELGNPEDIAGAAVYLLSDASRYMTGADLLIDGGYSCI